MFRSPHPPPRNLFRHLFVPLFVLGMVALSQPLAAQQGAVIPVVGEPKTWHKLTFDFTGPESSEGATPNPFTDYRFNITFTHVASGRTFLVPGYFAADGDAANTSADSGRIWRAHFAPDAEGDWSWQASFRSGENVAVSSDPAAGEGASHFDGATGAFIIQPSDKTGRDMRAKGRLEYVGKHHLRHAGTGRYFMKAGTDSPENLLSYADFDGDFKSDGEEDELVKTYAPHVADWQEGDPVWQGDKGKGMIGAINYLASEGLNAFSFLTMNINGDDRNVFPYVDYAERARMDVSRLGQWEIIFEHADRMGMHLHFKTQETENETLLDSGNTGNQRKLYYRELIARFGHHLALNWNLGEEINNASTAQKVSWAQYFHDNDPYHHPIVIHNGASHSDMLGDASKLTGFSLQMNEANFSDTYFNVARYIRRSAEAGRPWVVACDEPGDSRKSVRPDYDPGNSHRDARKNGMWGTIMAGGAGCEFYFGYDYPESDLTLQNFRSRDAFWDYCRYAVQFFDANLFPFEQMKTHPELVSGSGDNANRCLAKPGVAYLVQLYNGGSSTLDLTGASGPFTVKWYDPRNGGATVPAPDLEGGSVVPLGSPPDSPTEDWIVLVQAVGSGGTGTNNPPVVSAGVDKSAFLSGGTVAVNLAGSVSDDGLPDEFALTRSWTKQSGPGAVSFSSTTASITTATFAVPGSYVLRLTANDSELQAFDEVAVTINLPQSGGHRSFAPTQDAYLQNGENFNDTALRVERTTRVRTSYLQFDLATLDATPTGAVLSLTEGADDSGGIVTLRLYATATGDWSEGTLSGANAPAKGQELAVFTGAVADGATVDFDLGMHIAGPGAYGFILEIDASSRDVAFASKEYATVAARPVLTVATIENAMPVFAGFAVATMEDRAAVVSFAELLAAASDPDGDPVSVVANGGTTLNGGEVEIGAEGLTYTPAIDYIGPDSFTLTVQDGRGGFASGELSIEVIGTDGIEGGRVSLERGETNRVRFEGVPRLLYVIERSGDLGTWEVVGTIRADAEGAVEWSDPEPLAGMGFYRVGVE
ncbi:DUF5060 domain-containing protein [Luteolibacter sp. Populi]|uniref:DUF5060 domain-containing protein n=1 Tax=Luteolibacter sp. Populi TaxID=3230487 RepID=UPI0034667A61